MAFVAAWPSGRATPPVAQPRQPRRLLPCPDAIGLGGAVAQPQRHGSQRERGPSVARGRSPWRGGRLRRRAWLALAAARPQRRRAAPTARGGARRGGPVRSRLQGKRGPISGLHGGAQARGLDGARAQARLPCPARGNSGASAWSPARARPRRPRRRTARCHDARPACLPGGVDPWRGLTARRRRIPAALSRTRTWQPWQRCW